MVRKRIQIAAGEFKTSCLALLDHVADRGLEVIVTKRGKPVTRVVPVAGIVDVAERNAALPAGHRESGRRGVGNRDVIVLDTHAWIWWPVESALAEGAAQARLVTKDERIRLYPSARAVW